MVCLHVSLSFSTDILFLVNFNSYLYTKRDYVLGFSESIYFKYQITEVGHKPPLLPSTQRPLPVSSSYLGRKLTKRT
jgi:hypothetical protein